MKVIAAREPLWMDFYGVPPYLSVGINILNEVGVTIGNYPALNLLDAKKIVFVGANEAAAGVHLLRETARITESSELLSSRQASIGTASNKRFYRRRA